MEHGRQPGVPTQQNGSKDSTPTPKTIPPRSLSQDHSECLVPKSTASRLLVSKSIAKPFYSSNPAIIGHAHAVRLTLPTLTRTILVAEFIYSLVAKIHAQFHPLLEDNGMMTA